MLGQDCSLQPPWACCAGLGTAFHWLGISSAQSHAGFLGVPQSSVPHHNLTHTGLRENFCVRTLYTEP